MDTDVNFGLGVTAEANCIEPRHSSWMNRHTVHSLHVSAVADDFRRYCTHMLSVSFPITTNDGTRFDDE